MHWGLETLELMMELFKQHRVLWDNRFSKFNDKDAREKAFKLIASQLNFPIVTGDDVARKIRTMKTAYQVEIRNINAARTQGFYYNPTLSWFPIYRKVHEEIEKLKAGRESDDEMSGGEERPPASTNAGAKAKTPGRVAHRMAPKHSNRPQIPLQQRTRRLPPAQEVMCTDDLFDLDDNDDEYQVYGDVVAEKLRKLPQHRAFLLQNQIDKLLDKELEYDQSVLKYD